jgi:hypothetical protein
MRIRDNLGASPIFDSDGAVSGRIDVLPDGESQWGGIYSHKWDDVDALVACTELGNQLGYTTRGGVQLGWNDVADAQERIWFGGYECTGEEATLETCQHYDYGTGTGHLHLGKRNACVCPSASPIALFT